MRELIRKSILAGLLIAVAGLIYLKCQNKIVGSLLFSLGLLCVLDLKAKLFTGVVGNISSKKSFIEAIIILLFNILPCFLLGLCYRYTFGENQIYNNIVETQAWYRVLLEGSICGILIYLACTSYNLTKNPIIVILCVMGFILSGSLHSIACSFYLLLGSISVKAVLYLLLIVLGNSIGALTARYLHKTFKNIC